MGKIQSLLTKGTKSIENINFLSNKDIEDYFLYFDTDHTAKIIKKPIKNQNIKIDENTFHIANSKPYLLRYKKSNYKLYILHHSCNEPLQFKRNEEGEPVLDSELHPKEVSAFIEMKLLGDLLNMESTTDKKTQTIMLIVGAVLGAFAMFFAVKMGFLGA